MFGAYVKTKSIGLKAVAAFMLTPKIIKRQEKTACLSPNKNILWKGCAYVIVASAINKSGDQCAYVNNEKFRLLKAN